MHSELSFRCAKDLKRCKSSLRCRVKYVFCSMNLSRYYCQSENFEILHVQLFDFLLFFPEDITNQLSINSMGRHSSPLKIMDLLLMRPPSLLNGSHCLLMLTTTQMRYNTHCRATDNSHPEVIFIFIIIIISVIITGMHVCIAKKSIIIIILFCFFPQVSKWIIDHFTVMRLVAWPWNESETGVDLILLETSLLFLC